MFDSKRKIKLNTTIGKQDKHFNQKQKKENGNIFILEEEEEEEDWNLKRDSHGS